MRGMALVVSILAVASAAHAGNYTVATTPEQDQALEQVAAQMTSGGSPKATPQQAVQFIVERNLLTRVQAIQRDTAKAAACAKVTDAQAKQHLGCAAK